MRILTISDSPNLFSGLARVHRQIIDLFIEQGHTVLPCVWFGYDNDTLQQIKKKTIKPPPIYYDSNGTQVQMLSLQKGRKDFEEMKALYEIIKIAKPDIVFTIGDYWDFYYMQPLKVKTEFSFKWMAYLTIETDEIDEKMKPLLRYADAFAVPTQYGKSILEAETEKPVHFVPYGVDDKFKYLPDSERKSLREERDCSDKIRFITVAQNTWRKNLPALVQAVKLICHRDPHKRMQFYIHTNMEALDAQEASLYDLKSIVKKLGVEDWFVFPEDCTSLFSAPDDQYLVNEYNASDIFVLPSICEGFGLPILEAMACGLPVIANGASCMPEHLGATAAQSSFGPSERGWTVSSRTEIFPPDKLIKVIRHDALGQAIWEMSLWMSDPKRKDSLNSMRQNCIRYAKERTWQGMKRGIIKVLEEVAGPVSIPVEVID